MEEGSPATSKRSKMLRNGMLRASVFLTMLMWDRRAGSFAEERRGATVSSALSSSSRAEHYLAG